MTEEAEQSSNVNIKADIPPWFALYYVYILFWLASLLSLRSLKMFLKSSIGAKPALSAVTNL